MYNALLFVKRTSTQIHSQFDCDICQAWPSTNPVKSLKTLQIE